jgi:predicted phage replisome organizer
MAEKDKKYYWLKLKRDFFKRHDIQIIEDMHNGKDYILFYVKLLCESVDHNGELRFNEEIPYNDEMLATITRTNIDIVRSAIKIFTKLQMMEMLDDGTIYMREVQKMLGGETYWAERKRIQKERQLNVGYEYIKVLSQEQIALPNGETRFIDEKRYGGNGKLVWERAKGKCEVCGSEENLCIHHNNEYSNKLEDLVLVCRSCHRKIETNKITVGNFPTCPSKSIDIELEKDLDKEIKEKECIEKDTTPFDTFISKYSINVDNYSAMITEMDFNLLDKAFSESNWLCENYVSLSRICKDYEKIVGGYYKDFVKPKEDKPDHLTDAEFLILKGFSKEWVMALSEEERAEKRKKWE